jgi:hypothetical protein
VRKMHKGLVGAAVAVGLLVPAGVALATQAQPPTSVPHAVAPCTGDQQRDMLHLQDGSWYLAMGGPAMSRFGAEHGSYGVLGVSGPHGHSLQNGFGYQHGQQL